jgi:polysaccharide pyruvyl transferase WcaK-like protein
MTRSAEGSAQPQKVLVLFGSLESGNNGIRMMSERLSEFFLKNGFMAKNIDFLSHDNFLRNTNINLKFASLIKYILKPRNLREILKTYDLVIDLSEGDGCSNSYGNRRLLKNCLVRYVFSKNSSNFVFGPAGFGAFSGYQLFLVSWSFQFVRSCILRDPTSYELMKKAKVKSKIRISQDLAFRNKSQDLEVKKMGNSVAFNVSGFLFHNSNKKIQKNYQQVVFQVLEFFNQKKVEVTLVPHVFNLSGRDSDIQVANELIEKYPNSNLKLNGDILMAEATLSESSLSIGSRMHFCISALNHSNRVLAISYSTKFENVLSNFANVQILELPISDMRELRDTLENLWSNSSRLEDHKIKEIELKVDLLMKEEYLKG